MNLSQETQDLHTLVRRTGKLERELRLVKSIGLFGLIFGLIALCVVVFTLSNDRMQAETFALVDEQGGLVAELGRSQDGMPGLFFYDQGRNTRVWLGMQADGSSPRLVLGDEQGRPRLSLALAPGPDGQARLELLNVEGKARAALALAENGAPALLFADEQGKPVFAVPPPAGATPQERWVNYNDAGARAYAKGQPQEAQKFYLAALNEARNFGAEDLRTAATLNNLAVLYVQADKLDQAEDLYQRSLAVREKVLGGEHQQVAQSLNNLAFLRERQNRPEDAEDLYRRSIAMWEKTAGADTPALIAPLTRYADFLTRLERGQEAAPLKARAEKLQAQRDAARGNDADTQGAGP